MHTRTRSPAACRRWKPLATQGQKHRKDQGTFHQGEQHSNARSGDCFRKSPCPRRPPVPRRGRPALLHVLRPQFATSPVASAALSQVAGGLVVEGLLLLTVRVADRTDTGILLSLPREPNLSFPILLGADDLG